MGAIKYYPFVILAFKWIGATGKCIKAKKAAGETIDAWDIIECAASGLSVLDGELRPLAEAEEAKAAGKK